MPPVKFSPHPDVLLRRRSPAGAAAPSNHDAAPADTSSADRSASARWSRETVALVVLFAVALAAHGWFLSRNWTSGFLIGHEFRQSQTALIADWIDRQDNFSIRYDTPLFGKPWGAPLEWPLYEWCVVLVKRATGWPAYEAARTVSATFFYLTLPALFLLLGQAGVPRARRLLPLALALCCPVYVFYSRTFLIESTVLCFAVWWLAAFVQTLRTRHWPWALLAAGCGAVAGMIKSLTFAAWTVPAAGFGAWCLWSDWRARRGAGALLRTLAWGLGTVAAPLAATLWWTQFADAIKSANPAAEFLTSRALSRDNYGTFSLAARFSRETWQAFFHNWSFGFMPAWLFGACVAFGAVAARRTRLVVLGAAALFLVPQLAIPYAYAWQDYYLYACTLFAAGALGFAALGLLDSPLPAWLRWGWLVVPVAGLWGTYFRHTGYWDQQKVWSPGGSALMDALRRFTPENSVIIVAGSDWSATIPYYAQRRALMLGNGREHDPAFIEAAIDRLASEDISALVLTGSTRGHRLLAQRIASQAGLDPEPAFVHDWGEVFLARRIRDAAVQALRTGAVKFHHVTTDARLSSETPADQLPHALAPEEAAQAFPVVSPAPVRVQSRFGTGASSLDSVMVVMAHPEADLWVPPPPGARQITCEFGLLDNAIMQPNGGTDGVEFLVYGEQPDGRRRRIFQRALQPAGHPEDRGRQHAEFAYTPQPGETLVFATRPLLTYAFDWAYWSKIEVR